VDFQGQSKPGGYRREGETLCCAGHTEGLTGRPVDSDARGQRTVRDSLTLDAHSEEMDGLSYTEGERQE